MINWSKYRRYYPHISDQIYLNHAAIAPMNTLAREALLEFFELRTHKNIEFWPEALERKQEFLQLIGTLIHAPAENLALVPNTSSGLNILALGLDWQPGDHILLNDFEFPSNVIPFLNLQRLGVKIDFAHHNEGKIEIEELRKKIHPRTRLLSISFVEFLNGFRNDMKAIAQLCREHHIIFSVDAIQGVGALQMDVQEMGIDFLATGGHKWLMWPAGLGFIFISPRIFSQIYPVQAGWMSLETPWDFFNYHQKFAPTAQRFETGVFNTTGIIAATATLKMMLEIGTEQIQTKILQNTDYLIRKLQEANYRLYSDIRPAHRSGIVSFFHPEAEALFEYLKKNRITVSLREGKIRLSPHFYNNTEDFDHFFRILNRFDREN
ncbi:MAG: aminotransferase class V-fold PLP-dependent enzyme [Calditrichia bacterium]